MDVAKKMESLTLYNNGSADLPQQENNNEFVDLKDLKIQAMSKAEEIQTVQQKLVAVQRQIANSSTKNGAPPKQLLLYLVRMGSFTSMPKIKPVANADDNDVDYGNLEDLTTVLNECQEQLESLPSPIPRQWRSTKTSSAAAVIESEGRLHWSSAFSNLESETIRVFQWNALSQALGTGNDNFVKCPAKALDWRTRRFRMLEEIVRHNADVICLQEVDHFRFFRKSLNALGYSGHFTPKPDSPCLYLPENAGPDGCAIFYKRDKFDFIQQNNRILEVWKVQSNQIVLSVVLKSKKSGKEIVFATTHLKARNGALMPTLRNEQGKDLMDYLTVQARGRPIVCSGDFNAEPNEPVYQTLTSCPHLRLNSAYFDMNNKENDYTTWKIREDGEHIQTLDYIFHTPELRVESVLEMPEETSFRRNYPERLPNLAYASDHFSLVADLKLTDAKL